MSQTAKPEPIPDPVDAQSERRADKIRGGSKLQSASTATTVRLDAGSEPVITDGPFVEGKEVVSGYTEVEVDDLDQVLYMVRSWPGCPIVEIRPIMELPPAQS